MTRTRDDAEGFLEVLAAVPPLISEIGFIDPLERRYVFVAVRRIPALPDPEAIWAAIQSLEGR